MTALKSSELFGLLGSMYLCKPTREALAGWRAVLAKGAPAVPEELEEALERINVESPQELEDLLWDYTRLFLGPYRLPCPPWESVYASPKKLLMQEAYDTVKAMYAQAGVEVGDPNVLADHVGAELNFQAILLERADRAAADEQTYRQRAEQFRNEHLRNWIPRFTADVEDAADSDLYRALARATRHIVLDLGKEHDSVSLAPPDGPAPLA